MPNLRVINGTQVVLKSLLGLEYEDLVYLSSKVPLSQLCGISHSSVLFQFMGYVRNQDWSVAKEKYFRNIQRRM